LLQKWLKAARKEPSRLVKSKSVTHSARFIVCEREYDRRRENTTDVDSGIAVAYFFLFILTIKCFNTSRARSQEDIGAESRRKRDPLYGTVVSFPQKCATIDLKICYKMIKRLGLNFRVNWLKKT
jgi:hypothetical protein